MFSPNNQSEIKLSAGSETEMNEWILAIKGAQVYFKLFDLNNNKNNQKIENFKQKSFLRKDQILQNRV